MSTLSQSVLSAAQRAVVDWGHLLDAGKRVEFAAQVIAERLPSAPKKIGGLTRQQRRVVDYVVAFAEANGISPSFDEIRAHLGLASKSGVHRLVHGLIDRGVIDFMPDRARTIIVRPEYLPPST